MNKKEQKKLDDLFHDKTQPDNLRKVVAIAIDYFGTTERAKSWFGTENIGLGSVTPLSLVNTDEGMERVRDSITRLRYGMTA